MDPNTSGDQNKGLKETSPSGSVTQNREKHLPVTNTLGAGEYQEFKSALRTDGKREWVVPADVKGPFTSLRTAVFIILIAIYVALPWITIHGHPAVFLDITTREFYLFGATFNAQDIWLTVFLLTSAALGLVYITALAGRVWCGWACPQTVFIDGMYRRIERLIEGPRDTRLKRNKGPWNFDKIWRKSLTQSIFIIVSILLAHVFLSYFVSLSGLFQMVGKDPGAHPEAFLIVSVLSAILYFNFAWFREQFCIVLCPYGRIQSALIDINSIIIGYDKKRGEPRGKVSDPNAGHCIDCKRCLVVCPTGIDIRNGLQMECIGCTACIDACDDIMAKIGRPKGLIRYDSLQGLGGEKTRFIRPRIILYSAVLAVLVGTGFTLFHRRADLEANVLRIFGPPYVLEQASIRNAFEVHLVNKNRDTTEYEIRVETLPGATTILPLHNVMLAPLGQARLPLFVTLPESAYHHEFTVYVVIRNKKTGESLRVKAPFLGPNRGS